MQVNDENQESRNIGDTNSNVPAQNSGMPLSKVELFKQGIRARFEAYAFGATSPLEYFESNNNEAIKDYIKLTILELSYMFNEFELLDFLSQSEE